MVRGDEGRGRSKEPNSLLELHSVLVLVKIALGKLATRHLSSCWFIALCYTSGCGDSRYFSL